MFVKIVNEYWMMYAMVAVAAAGIISRLYLSGIYRGLLRDLKRNGSPRRKLIQQMKKIMRAAVREMKKSRIWIHLLVPVCIITVSWE